MEGPDDTAQVKAADSSKPEGDHPIPKDGKKESEVNSNIREDQQDVKVNHASPAPNATATSANPNRPHPSVISEFDPFASPSNGSSQKAGRGTVSSSAGTQPARLSSKDKDTVAQTLLAESSSNTVAQAPRKQAQKTLQGSFPSSTDTSSDSPSAARQKQSRSNASEIAEQEHRHAGAMVTEGESRTNTKPKELAFDFQGFLAQLRSRQAEPIQKYLKRSVVFCARARLGFLIICSFQLSCQLCKALIYSHRASQADTRLSEREQPPPSVRCIVADCRMIVHRPQDEAGGTLALAKCGRIRQCDGGDGETGHEQIIHLVRKIA
jgi:hypothetical protein